MSRRKLGFAVRKRYSRKLPTACHHEQDCDELVVKFPLSAYKSSSVPSTSVLHSRLNLSPVPGEWTSSLILPSPAYLAIYKLQILPPFTSAEYTFMLTVAPDFTWTLCIGRRKVDIEQCQVLRGAHIKLCSVDAIISVLSTLEASKLCEGNPDNKFAELVSHHNGTFKDQSSKHDTGSSMYLLYQ